MGGGGGGGGIEGGVMTRRGGVCGWGVINYHIRG